MKLVLKKTRRCAFEECREVFTLPNNRKSLKKYHKPYCRKQAWKKRHWDRYLAWQREYVRKKKLQS